MAKINFTDYLIIKTRECKFYFFQEKWLNTITHTSGVTSPLYEFFTHNEAKIDVSDSGNKALMFKDEQGYFEIMKEEILRPAIFYESVRPMLEHKELFQNEVLCAIKQKSYDTSIENIRVLKKAKN